jgi:hypothetical protein
LIAPRKGEEGWLTVEKVFHLTKELRYAGFHDIVGNLFDEDGAEEVYYDRFRPLRGGKAPRVA